MEFTKSNITKKWEWDLINKFPEFFLDISDEVMDIYNNWSHKNASDFPKFEDLVNLRYGFEFDSNWKDIMENHLLSIMKLIKRAKSNKHEIFYKGFIMKEKFGTLRDQGIFSGKDQDIYKTEYYNLVADIYKISAKVN